MAARKHCSHLYWVTTDDNDEDWFVLAPTVRSAAKFHEDCEGYDPRDATARLIIANVTLPKYADGTPPCHAQISDLEALGFQVDDPGPYRRIVSFRGELFIDGPCESQIQSARELQLKSK